MGDVDKLAILASRSRAAYSKLEGVHKDVIARFKKVLVHTPDYCVCKGNADTCLYCCIRIAAPSTVKSIHIPSTKKQEKYEDDYVR